MEITDEIKARLNIEDLVGQYCQLQKKGRNFVCICPFHNDTRPSFLVSPDKGIAYCFACQSGGDIFSFYQKIEGVDFRQAIKDLADKVGLEVPDVRAPKHTKDEKERLRDCLQEAETFYCEQYRSSEKAKAYILKRGTPAEQVETFGLGFAPDSFSATYEHLLKKGYSKSEILAAGLGIQKDLKEEKIYDRFRNRLMFPIHDAQGRIVGFGGRTLGEDDAKYINSSEGPLYHKSQVLYGLHYAKEAMRTSKSVILVEGYFDVLACHKAGIEHAVAASGTALTDQHVKILKRTCETVILCMDRDLAGKQAAERAFQLCIAQGLQVRIAIFDQKDPDEAFAADAEGFAKRLTEEHMDYVEHVLQSLRSADSQSATGKREALQRIVPLLKAVPSAVEREHYMQMAAGILGTTEKTLQEDIESFQSQTQEPAPSESDDTSVGTAGFSKIELSLGLFLLYPQHRSILKGLIEPEKGFTRELYQALLAYPEDQNCTLQDLALTADTKEHASILQLYCEEHGMGSWTESMAVRELQQNCGNANREMVRKKLQEIQNELLEARRSGKRAEEQQLNTKYQQVLKLAKIASI